MTSENIAQMEKPIYLCRRTQDIYRKKENCEMFENGTCEVDHDPCDCEQYFRKSYVDKNMSYYFKSRMKSDQVLSSLKCLVGLPGRTKKEEVKKVMWMAEDLCNSFRGW